MSVTHVIGSVVLAGLLTGQVAPDELLVDQIDGFRTTETSTDLDADDMALLRPDALAHLEPGTPERDAVVAAVRIWEGDDEDRGIDVTIELVRSLDPEAAEAVVDQAAANAVGLGLAATDPVFVGAWAYRGSMEGTEVAITSWSQGLHSVSVTVRATGAIRADEDSALGAALRRQAALVLAATGAVIEADAAVDEEAAADRPRAVWYTGATVAAVVAVIVVRRMRRVDP